MAVNLPQPLFVPGGSDQRSTAEQAMLTLLGQAPQLGLSIAQNIQQKPLRKAELEGVQARTKTEGLQQANYQSQIENRKAEFDAEQAQLANEIALKQQAYTTARGILSNDESNSAQLVQAFDLLYAMDQIGFDSSQARSFIDSQLPQSEKDKLDLERTRLEIANLGVEVNADAFSTNKMIEMGILPPDTPLLPGSSRTLQSILQSREGKVINWTQEGLDFISSRIGESAGGTGNFVVGVPGEFSVGGGGGITVDQAIAEWSALIERFAPAGAKETELKRIGSGSWQRALSKELAINEVKATLLLAPGMPEENIRRTLRGGYTDDEITEIIRTARQRNLSPRR